MADPKWLKLPKGLKNINKTYEELQQLNDILDKYGINIFYISKKGWRCWRQDGTETQISWFGDGVALEWFQNPNKMAAEFIEKYANKEAW